MFRHTGSLILVFITTLLPAGASGFVVNPNVVNFSSRDYGGGNKNWDLAQDSGGTLYIANNDGLLEYDGTSWNLYSEVTGKGIRSVAIDAEDRIFTGGYEEFGYWQRGPDGTLTYNIISDLLPPGTINNEDIWRILPTEGGVYFQSFARIYYYDYLTLHIIDPRRFIMFLHRVEGEFYIHSQTELLKVTGDGLDALLETQLQTVRVILPYDDGALMLGTGNSGIYIYRDGAIQDWNTEINKVITHDDLNCALRLDNGDYIFGTLLNGLYHTDSKGRVLNHFSTANFLANNTILSLMADRDGNIWVGMEKGLARLDYRDDFNFFIDHTRELGSVYTSALYEGNLYLGTNRGLFYIPWEAFGESDPISKARLIRGTQGQVWTLREFDGQLLCGHNNGLFSVRNNRPYFLYENNGVFDITDYSYGDEHYVVAATYSLPQVLRNGPHGYALSNSLEGFSAPCSQVFADHLGSIWFAHMQEDLYRCKVEFRLERIYKTETFTSSRDFDNGNPQVRIAKMGGRLVFVSADNFFLYNDIYGRMERYSMMDELDLLPRNINRIVESGRDKYWVVGKNSVSLIENVQDSLGIVRQYYLGQMNLSTVDGFENVCVLNDTLSLVCLDNGFLIHDMGRVRTATKPATSPFLRSVVSGDRSGRAHPLPLDGKKREKISYGYNNLVFNYSYPHISGEEIFFSYRMKGLNDKWETGLESGTIKFDRLPRGEYTLQVRVSNVTGEESPVSQFSFSVASPWYLSFFAFVCYFMVVIAAFFVLWRTERARLRGRHIKRMQKLEKEYLLKQNEQLKSQVEKREKELMNVTHSTISKNKVLSNIKSELDNAHEAGSKIPSKLYDRLNGLIDNAANLDEDWKLFVMHFEQNHSSFFNDIKARYPGLSSGDLKLCACLRLNLSTKDIASLLCISVRGVEIGRYRLRKKLGLESHVNLNDWLIENF